VVSPPAVSAVDLAAGDNRVEVEGGEVKREGRREWMEKERLSSCLLLYLGTWLAGLYKPRTVKLPEPEQLTTRIPVLFTGRQPTFCL
jgi:hypothetical protein